MFTSHKTVVYEIFTAFIAVMVALAALPITPAYAATCTSTATDTNWNSASHWSGCGGSVPQNGDTVVIATTTVVDTDTNFIASLTINTGRTLTIGNDNSNGTTVTVTGNVTINSGATFATAGNGGNLLRIGGNLINSGIFDMSTAGAAVNTTFNGAANQTISGTGGTTNFHLITIDNTGTSGNNIVEVTASNFTAVAGFLTLIDGVFKLSTSATITPVGVDTNIDSAVGLIVNDSGALVDWGNSDLIVTGGVFQMLAGTFSLGNGNDVLGISDGTMILSGGVLNINGRFQMSGGATTINGATVNLDPQATFALGSTIHVFESRGAANLTFTSGTVTIVDPHSASASGNEVQIVFGAGTKDFSGGTIRLGDGVSATSGSTDGFDVNCGSGVALGNLVIDNPSGTDRFARLVTNDCIVGGNFTITAGEFRVNGQDLSVAGDFTNSGTFTTGGSNMVTFNGTGAQTITGANQWYGLAVTGITARTVSFQSGGTQIVTNSLIFTGAAGQLLTLAPTGIAAWQLKAPATQSLSYVSVSNSDASSGTTVNASNGTNTNGGNNTNWFFGNVAPTVTTQAVLNIGTTTATGNGNITDLGASNPTAYGVVWSTALNPTTANSVSDLGAASATGAFTAPITGLTPGMLYHVRAFAANTAGTSYGADVTFIATAAPAIASLDHAAFTVGTAGPAFTVTTTGYPAPSITQGGDTLPSGITFTDNHNGAGTLDGTPASGTLGTYHITFTAANGIGSDAVQNFTLTVIGGPTILINGVHTAQDTGDGYLDENEIVTVNLNKFTFTFSKDVIHVTSSDPNYGASAINPANYMLVNDNGNGFEDTPATITCGNFTTAHPNGGDDFKITIDSVTYSNGDGAGPFVATLTVTNPLANGSYRLYICGTTSITDPNGLKLAGNGSLEGTDFIRNFIVQMLNNGGSGNGNGGGAFTIGLGLIPVTGFAAGHSTLLPAQPADNVYSSFNTLRMEIPSLGVNVPIIGVAYKDNGWDLTWLGNNAGYLDGSAYPTWSGNSVLTGHVVAATGAPGPFAYIKDLQIGDKINIHFGGQIFIYEVRENRQVMPTRLSTIFKHEDYSWLTLVTCEDYNNTRKGYNYRRYARAVLVSVVPEK